MKLTFFNISGSLLRVTLSAMMIFTAVFATGCAEDYNPPSEPIFSDVELIEIEYPRNTYSYSEQNRFQYNVPDDVSFLVLAIFEPGNTPQLSGDSITNDMNAGWDNITGGLTMSTATKEDLRVFDGVSQEFSDILYLSTAPPAGEYHMVLLGYDSNYILVAASPDWRFDW